MKKDTNLILLPTPSTHDERIQARINEFRLSFMKEETDMGHVDMLLDVILEYLSEFGDEPELNQAFVKLNEVSFWISSYLEY